MEEPTKVAGLSAQPVGDTTGELGEGPRWDPSINSLFWVDVRARTLFQSKWASRTLTTIESRIFPGEVSCAIPISNRPGELILPCAGSLLRIDETGSIVTLGIIEPDDRLQLNDAACDNRGRLWVGTFGRKGEREVGSLFKVDVDGTVTKAFEHISLSNGIGWSPDGQRMYYVDSVTGQIDLFDYDLDHGLAIGRRRFVSLADGPGLPDGLVVDTDGGVWVAIWDRAVVLRFSADGTLTHRVDLPVARPTACCFGGEDLRTLFITSAWAELPREERLAQPFAGRIFCCEDLPFGGLPTSPYAGPVTAGSLVPQWTD